MDQELLVDDRFEDGEKLLSQLVRSGFDVTVAFWVKTSEDGWWYLYIASSENVPGKFGDAYGRLYVAWSQLSQPAVSLSEVKLVQPSEPIARDAMVLRDRKPARLPVRYREKRLGELLTEEVYIYPKTGPMTRDEVIHTAIEILKLGGRARPATFTFADGSAKQVIPTGMHLPWGGPKPRLQFDLFDPATGKPEVVAADDVVNIQ